MKNTPKVCPECGKTCKTPAGLSVHMRTQHKKHGYGLTSDGNTAAVLHPKNVEAERKRKEAEYEKPLMDPKDLEGLEEDTDPCALLKLEAEAAADRLGHDLANWRDERGWSRTKCTTCGMDAFVSPWPMQGNPRVGGKAVLDRCP